MKREELVKGTILKDNLMGIEWKVLDPETLAVESVNGKMKITIEANKLDNFVIVSMPTTPKKETPVQQTINFGLSDGYIINLDTNEKVCNQGELRFNYIFTRTQDKGFIIVAQVTDICYAGKKEGNVYRYYFKRDKFEKIITDVCLEFLYPRNKWLETKKYYFCCSNTTGTYGDFRNATYYVFDKKFNLLKMSSFNYYMSNPVVMKDNGDEVLGVMITNRSTGMCSTDDSILIFTKLTKDGLMILNKDKKTVNLGGNYRNDFVTLLTKKNLVGVCNRTHFGIYDAADDYSLVENYELGFSVNDNISLKQFKFGSKVTTIKVSLDDEKDYTIQVTKTKDRGVIKERMEYVYPNS